MTQTIIIDLNRCIGCLGCIVACKMEKGLKTGFGFNKVLRVGPYPRHDGARFPDVGMYFLPLMCQHCETPSCAEACPENAIYQTEDGFVLLDSARCSGCRLCTEACPYGLCDFDDVTDTAAKCDLCHHRIERGELPACVAQCAGGALVFADLNKKDSPAYAMPGNGNNVYSLPDHGTKPRFRFILNKTRWVENPFT